MAGTVARLNRAKAKLASRTAPRPPIDISVATTPSQVVEAWQLVYRAYHDIGLIDPNPQQIYTVPRAVCPETAVILGRCGGMITATTTVAVDGPNGLSLDDVCRGELNVLRSGGRRLVEIGLLADRSPRGGHAVTALLHLMRHAFFYARLVAATDIVIGVHPHHARFYQRMLGFVAFAEFTCCARVNDHPVAPLRMDIAHQLNRPTPPRGIAFFKANPLGRSAYAHRVRPQAALFHGTPLGSYLRDRRPPALLADAAAAPDAA